MSSIEERARRVAQVTDSSPSYYTPGMLSQSQLYSSQSLYSQSQSSARHDDDSDDETSSLASTSIGLAEAMPLMSRSQLGPGSDMGDECAPCAPSLDVQVRLEPGPKRTRRVVSSVAFMVVATAMAAVIVLLVDDSPSGATVDGTLNQNVMRNVTALASSLRGA